MKVEIKKEFSSVFMTDRFWVYVDGMNMKSFATAEEAHEDVAKLKIAHEKTYPPELIYSEEF